MKGGSTARHTEPKKQRAIWLTPGAWENLEEIAEYLMISSRSELIELIGQGRLKIVREEQKTA